MPLCQSLPQKRRKFPAEKGFSGGQKPVPVRRFRPEAEGAAHPGQNPHASRPEALRRRQGGGDGQLQHQIRPAQHRRLRPEGFIHNGGSAPLHEIAAHGADNGAVLPKFLPDPGNLLPVTQVKGVIFAYDTDGPQNSPSIFQKNSTEGLRN